jgi:hypothetical protein
MIEWYDGAHELLEHSNLFKHDFACMVKENPIEFRYQLNVKISMNMN